MAVFSLFNEDIQKVETGRISSFNNGAERKITRAKGKAKSLRERQFAIQIDAYLFSLFSARHTHRGKKRKKEKKTIFKHGICDCTAYAILLRSCFPFFRSLEAACECSNNVYVCSDFQLWLLHFFRFVWTVNVERAQHIPYIQMSLRYRWCGLNCTHRTALFSVSRP